MSIPERDQACTILIKKLTVGEPLDAVEKSHLSQCAGCMREVILHLDQLAEEVSPTQGLTGVSRKQPPTQTSPEVLQALERGRRVLAREFGL